MVNSMFNAHLGITDPSIRLRVIVLTFNNFLFAQQSDPVTCCVSLQSI